MVDVEIKKGFQEFQFQVNKSKSKIAHVDACHQITLHDIKANESIIEYLNSKQDGQVDIDVSKKFIYEPVGRMLVRRNGLEAKEFLEKRGQNYKTKLEQYELAKEVCAKQLKESEENLRILVNKRLNKSPASVLTSSEAETQDKSEIQGEKKQQATVDETKKPDENKDKQ